MLRDLVARYTKSMTPVNAKSVGITADPEVPMTTPQVTSNRFEPCHREQDQDCLCGVTFEAEILGQAGWLEIEFASDGRVIEREAKEIGEEDDEDEDDEEELDEEEIDEKDDELEEDEEAEEDDDQEES